MNLQEENKALKERIAELEELAKDEQGLPQEGGKYWWINDEGGVYRTIFLPDRYEEDSSRLKIGNLFKTEQDAHFAVEKLKVEAELRKFSRPFKYGDENFEIVWNNHENNIELDWSGRVVHQSVIYFESGEIAEKAIESVGEERIKKYIFGMED